MKRQVVYSRVAQENYAKGTSPITSTGTPPYYSATVHPPTSCIAALVYRSNPLHAVSQRVLLKRFIPGFRSNEPTGFRPSVEPGQGNVLKPISNKSLPRPTPLTARPSLMSTHSKNSNNRRLLSLAAASLRQSRRRRVLKIIDC